MRNTIAGILAVLAAVSASTVEASQYCGAASYRCCPTQCCQPTACYTACRVERQTCYRTVYENICEPQQYTVNRTVYENVFEDVQRTCYRTVSETHYREQQYQVQRPVTETETHDVAEALLPIKQRLAFYVGGMGAKKRNFHRELMARMGYEDESLQIQERFLSGDRAGALEAVPDRFADELSLVGTPARIRERLQAWRDSKVTQLLVGASDINGVRRHAELILG